MLASSLIAQRPIEEACAIGQEVLGATRTVSYRTQPRKRVGA